MEVRVGERNVAIPPFNARKLDIAGQIASNLSEHVSTTLMSINEFSRQWGEANKIAITRERNKPRFDNDGEKVFDGWGFSDEDFEREGPVIEMPAIPSEEQQLMVGFTSIYSKARDDVLRLVALATMSKDELRQAKKDGQVPEVLLDRGEELMDEADGEQFAELVAVAVTQARKQFSADLWGKVRRAWSPEDSNQGSQQTSPQEGRGDGSGSDKGWEPRNLDLEVGTGVAADSEESSRTSSTPSPEPTVGRPT